MKTLSKTQVEVLRTMADGALLCYSGSTLATKSGERYALRNAAGLDRTVATPTALALLDTPFLLLDRQSGRSARYRLSSAGVVFVAALALNAAEHAYVSQTDARCWNLRDISTREAVDVQPLTNRAVAALIDAGFLVDSNSAATQNAATYYFVPQPGARA